MLRHLTIFSALAAASCSTPSPLPFDSPEIPDAVREASGCAVNIVAFSGDGYLVDPADVAEVRARIVSMESKGEMPPKQRRIAEMLLDDVIAADEERDVGMHALGAGFVAHDPTLLWTCQHVVMYFAPKVGDEIEIVLFDNNEQILFDSRNGRDTAVVEHLGSGGTPHLLMRGSDALVSDFATIRLSRAPCRHIGTFRDTPTIAGEGIYLPTREIYGSPPRPHAEFVVGETIAPPGTHYYHLTTRVLFGEELGKSMLFTDASGDPGLSGSPIFDATGAIVGITTTKLSETLSGVRAHVLRTATQ